MSEDIDPEQNTATPFLLKVWYVYMFIVIACLYIAGIVSRDSSVNSYIMLGVIAMLVSPLKSIIEAINRNKELKREYEERKRKAAEAKNKQSEEEGREQGRAKVMAANELEGRHAAKTASPRNT